MATNNVRVESGGIVRAWKAWVLTGAAAALIAGCGGGGGTREFGSEGDDGGASPGGPELVELSRSAPSITSDGRQSVRLFATVKDSGNVALAGVPVSFSASGTGLTLAVVRGTTDVNGQAEATLAVTDPVNRSIDVQANAAGRSAATSVQVVGTSTAISGPASVVLNAPAVFQVAVKDASGTPIAGKSVSALSSAGNTLSVSPSTTDAQGTVSVVMTPTKAGPDTITVSAAGATGAQAVQVSSTSISFEAPPAAAEFVVSPASAPAWRAVSVRLLDAGAPLPAGTRVEFTATRGVLGAGFALTDAAGLATTSIYSPLAGRSMITATAPNGTVATREVTFVADRAAKLEVQASPSTLGVNLSGAVSESSQIIAVVRDLVDNPVKGARVNFSVIDPSAGPGLSQGFAITDASGRATVTFYPGAIPSGENKIVVNAVVDCTYVVTGVQCVSGGVAPDSISLTAARRALQVRIGTGNEIVKVEEPGAAPVFNEMPYGVLVTDSAGNPVSGVTLNATVVALDYRKGFWINPCAPAEACWIQVNSGVADGQVANCKGEDLNENLLLDKVPFNEDANGDGVLTPGNVAAAYFGPTGLATTVTTDSEGSAVLRIRYLRDRSAWASVRVRVTASVPDGTEGAEKVQFLLPVLAEDVSNPLVAPPGATSPYGTGSCP